MPSVEALPERQRNRLLRRVDWRFLLRQPEVPRLLDLGGGADAEALRLVTRPVEPGEQADLAVLGFPTPSRLEAARGGLRPGGELICRWRPRPGGARRARKRLRRAGFGEAHLYRPGPGSGSAPEVWLPLDAPAEERQIAARPPRSRLDALLRRGGQMLAPTYAVARIQSDPGDPAQPDDEIDRLLPTPAPWALLTGGEESDAKVVGFPTGPAGVVAKFARLAKADAALEREAEILRGLERERPSLGGIPRLRASGRRGGGTAIVQDAVRGKPLSSALNPDSFATVAPAVTRWLVALAGEAAPEPASSWFERLVSAPLDELERDFGALLPAGFLSRARQALAAFGDLPPAWEHRDFGPWNVVIAEDGAAATIDWEDAEPRGLPGLDLVYFLASAAFAIDGAQGADRARESYRRLLDPATPLGAVASACVDEYRSTLGIEETELRRLSLLCWVVQALIAFRREHEDSFFIHLAEDELNRLEDSR